jgi:hypothetical protein
MVEGKSLKDLISLSDHVCPYWKTTTTKRLSREDLNMRVYMPSVAYVER